MIIFYYQYDIIRKMNKSEKITLIDILTNRLTMNVFVKDWPIHIIFLNMFNDISCQTNILEFPTFC